MEKVTMENPEVVESLDLDRFSPKEAELHTLANECKNLIIKGVEDFQGYSLVRSKRMELRKARTDIAKQGKALRENAIKFQRAVIDREKELIDIILPVENDLEAQEKAIDEEKVKLRRKAVLPERMARLKDINCDVSEEEILAMDDVVFNEFFNAKHSEFLAKKEEAMRLEQEKREAELKAEQDKIEQEKQKIAEQQRIEEAKKQAEKEAQEKALKEAKLAKMKAEEEKERAVLEAQQKAEAEKQKLIDEQKAQEEARIAEENRVKAEAEAKIQAEKEAQEKLERVKAYKEFAESVGYNEATKSEFKLVKEDNSIIFYKKVGTFKLN